MNINFNAITNQVPSAKTKVKTGGVTKSEAPPARAQADQLAISPQGREAAAQGSEPFSKMEDAIQSGDIAALMEAAKEKAGQLEVNWNAVVDPDGTIYGAAYVESLVTQYEKASSTIKEHYSDGHQENLTFDNPYTHLMQKYKIIGSPYFKSDMSAAERDMAFRQERALLWGGNVALNDPYALKSSGGVLDVRDADRIARQAAQDKLDEMIKERMEASKGESNR